jgi:hypothetical protein
MQRIDKHKYSKPSYSNQLGYTAVITHSSQEMTDLKGRVQVFRRQAVLLLWCFDLHRNMRHSVSSGRDLWLSVCSMLQSS